MALGKRGGGEIYGGRRGLFGARFEGAQEGSKACGGLEQCSTVEGGCDASGRVSSEEENEWYDDHRYKPKNL